jgi:PAS domain S-box-containing protein
MVVEEKGKANLNKELNMQLTRINKLANLESNQILPEDTLRESDEMYRNLVERANDGIVIVQDGILKYINPRLAEITGYDVVEATDTPFTNYIHPDEVSKAVERYNRRIRGEKIKTRYESRLIHKNGNIIEVEFNGGIITYQGRPADLVIIRDISEHKRAMEALKESEERFRGIAEESFDIIFIVDSHGAFLYVSPATKQILGFKPEELTGKHLNNFLPTTESEKVSQVTKQLLNGGNIHGLELKIPNKFGKTVFFEINANSIVKNGVTIGYQGIARDITERKHAEEEMKKRLMKFKLDEGKVYLVLETTSTISQEAFKELLKVGYQGLVFYRTNPSDFKNLFEGEAKFLWLSENGKESSLHPELNEIKQMISSVENKKAIYFERLDYIISKHSFKKTLGFVQNLRELAIIYNHIILFSIDPTTVNKSQLRLLEKETNDIEPMLKPKLPEHFINILRFVYEQNMIGNKPSYSDVEQELGFCKPTIRKRIRQLISAGYVSENTRGRSKVVELNERGKSIFLK